MTTKTPFSGVLGNLRTGQLSNPSPSRSPALTADNLSAVRRADLRPTREGVATRPACPFPITRRRTCRRSPANVCADQGRATRPRVRSPANVPRGFQKVSQCFRKSPFWAIHYPATIKYYPKLSKTGVSAFPLSKPFQTFPKQAFRRPARRNPVSLPKTPENSRFHWVRRVPISRARFRAPEFFT